MTSRIADSLADHILADAENWWIRTLAYHQGTADLALVHAAIAFLIQGNYLAPVTRPDDVAILTLTELGKLTTRFMVPVVVGAQLRAFLTEESVPANPEHAEGLLGQAIATFVPQFAEAPVSEELRPLVARLLRAHGHPDRLDDTPAPPGLAPATACDPGDVAQVAFTLVAWQPPPTPTPQFLTCSPPPNTATSPALTGPSVTPPKAVGSTNPTTSRCCATAPPTPHSPEVSSATQKPRSFTEIGMILAGWVC